MTALAGRFGGIAALDPRNGEIRALAGIAFSAPAAAGLDLQDRDHHGGARGGHREAVRPSSRSRPRRRSTASSSRTPTASSAAAASANSFAHSCNSVFAPARRGARAPRRWWTRPSASAGTASPTRARRGARARCRRRPRSSRRSRSARPRSASSARSPRRCMMASVAQTIAARGVRAPAHAGAGRAHARACGRDRRRVARTIGSLMVDVVDYGTGTAAALPGVKVAGKTGTAELEDTRDPETGETAPLGPLQHRRLVHGLRAGPAAARSRWR